MILFFKTNTSSPFYFSSIVGSGNLLAPSPVDRFRSKYYPDEAEKGKADGLRAVKKRLLVFLELYEENWLDKVRLQQDKTDEISRVLDAGKVANSSAMAQFYYAAFKHTY